MVQLNTSDPRLIVIRSFDINKPGAEVDDLQGGSIFTGTARAGSRDPSANSHFQRDHLSARGEQSLAVCSSR
ncbi:hypothetical protein EV702DRAFT_1095344, partial [Suillus placidus]